MVARVERAHRHKKRGFPSLGSGYTPGEEEQPFNEARLLREGLRGLGGRPFVWSKKVRVRAAHATHEDDPFMR
jgi:hypothetical protein